MKEQLEPNKIYEGSVLNYDPAMGVYAVSVRGITLNCMSLTWVMTRFLGLMSTFVYPPGTSVKVVYGGDESSVIIGALSAGMLNNTSAEGLTTTTGEEVVPPQTETTPNRRQRNISDMLSGELDLTNALGVGLRCLTTIAQLTSSGLATVETCAMNDMVRIISDTFRHHHAAGDDEIFHQGQGLNIMSHSTSYDHEAWGVDADSPKLELLDGNKKAVLDSAQDTGRWRYSYFRGMLGNFVHMFVSDPTETLGEFSEASKRAGKARVQIMNDGTLLAQTVTEVCIEKVVRVPVPVQKTKANQTKEQENMDRRLLRLWEGFKSAEGVLDAAYQLREYTRWMNTRYSLSRFLQRTDDWRIYPENEQPEPDPNNQENDVEEQNENLNGFYESYACIRIMRDGTILHWCGYGSVISMSEGDVRIHAVRDLELTAARDIILRPGRDLKMSVFRHIDITSAIGGITTKTRTWVKTICELGRILIKSTGDPEEETTRPVFLGSDEDFPEAEMGEYGVVIDTPRSKSAILSHGGILLQTTANNVTPSGDQPPTVFEEADGDIILRANGRARVNLISRTNDVNVASGRYFTTKAREVWADTNSMLYRVNSRFSIYRGEPGSPEPGEDLSLTGGTLRVQRINTTSLDSRDSLRGPKNPNGSARDVQPTSQPEPVGTPTPPYTPWSALLERDDMIDWRGSTSAALPNVPFQTWVYPEFVYEGKYRESITEQFIRLEDVPDPSLFAELDPAQAFNLERKHGTVGDASDPASFVNNPVIRGRELWWQHEGGENLREPSSTDPSTLSVKPTKYEESKTTWRRVKL